MMMTSRDPWAGLRTGQRRKQPSSPAGAFPASLDCHDEPVVKCSTGWWALPSLGQVLVSAAQTQSDERLTVPTNDPGALCATHHSPGNGNLARPNVPAPAR
jgi:hypothetical protein